MPFGPDDLEQASRRKHADKPRPKGSLPYLPDEREPETLRAWLTRALRPPSNWGLSGFERTGRDGRDPCALAFVNGRESRRYRIKRQTDLMRSPRLTLASATDGWLAVPHLTAGEIEDVWAALCTLGRVLTEFDEPEQTREWVEAYLPATSTLAGFSLVPDSRHDALMAIRRAGEFRRGDAEQMRRGADPGLQRRPTRVVDAMTGEQWIRPGELAAYVRWVLGVEPLSHGTLRARLQEIGVDGRYFEDRRPPHPKLALYRLSESLIEGLEGA